MTDNVFEMNDVLKAEVLEPQKEVIMSEKEAVALTDSIKSTATAVCLLIKRAHDERAWEALGYDSWSAYIEGEFDFSRVRSYQLLAQGKVIESINEAAGAELYLTEKEAKSIKQELGTITQKIKEETDDLDSEEDRTAVAKSIIDDEIESQRYNDEINYNEGKDIERMITEDGGSDEYDDNSLYTHQAHTSTFEEDQPVDVKDKSEAQFYLNNLNHTIEILKAFPSAKDLSKSISSDETERIKLRNEVKYAIKWLSDFESEI